MRPQYDAPSNFRGCLLELGLDAVHHVHNRGERRLEAGLLLHGHEPALDDHLRRDAVVPATISSKKPDHSQLTQNIVSIRKRMTRTT